MAIPLIPHVGPCLLMKGKPASPAMQSKIRNIMPCLSSHAIRCEWAY